VHKSQPLVLALAAAAAALGWQWLTVHANYGGNWSALYCTGALRGVPAPLAAEHIWQFPASNGYDGQMYHYVAHDPWMRDPLLAASIDSPRLRYARILVPGLAFLLAAGRSNWIDPAYRAVILLFIAAGVYWSAAYCQSIGHAPLWGLLFMLLPATLVSIDRMTVDVALAALAAGFAFHVRAPSWRLPVILGAAALVRETGCLLLIAYGGYLLLGRCFKRAAWYALAAAPALAWYAYVYARTSPVYLEANLVPLSAILRAILDPLVYPHGTSFVWLARTADWLALGGMLMAFALVIARSTGRARDPLWIAAACFAAVGLILQQPEQWLNVYDFGRIYSPVLLFLGLDSLQRGSWIAMAPWMLMLPRIGLQFGNQMVGIWRG
jgi:hypothetical protein